MPTTEYDPTTMKRVVNHDASRRQKQLDDVMARLAEEQPGLVEQPGVHEAPAPVSIEPAKPEDKLPELEPAPLEPTVELPPLEPNPVDPVANQKDWEAMAKEWKKRSEDAMRALTPAQQKAARLDKELREERESTKSELNSLKEMIATLAQTVATANLPKQEPLYDPDLDSDLDNIDPMLAERLRKLSRSVSQSSRNSEMELKREIEVLKQRDAERQKLAESTQIKAQEQAWETTFTQLVPDFAQFLPGTPHGQNLATWAATMAPEYSNAIENPKSYTPFFIAQIINAYKSNLRGNTTPSKRPSLGDIANPALTGSAPVKVSAPEPESFCTTFEMQNATKIMDEMMRKATATKNRGDREALLASAQEFSDKYQRTLNKRNNQRG